MARNKLVLHPYHRCRQCGEWAQAILPPVDDLCGRCEVMSGKYPYRRWRGRGDGKISQGTTAYRIARQRAAMNNDLGK